MSRAQGVPESDSYRDIMAVMGTKELPINSAARNAVWTYPGAPGAQPSAGRSVARNDLLCINSFLIR